MWWCHEWRREPSIGQEANAMPIGWRCALCSVLGKSNSFVVVTPPTDRPRQTFFSPPAWVPFSTERPVASTHTHTAGRSERRRRRFKRQKDNEEALECLHDTHTWIEWQEAMMLKWNACPQQWPPSFIHSLYVMWQRECHPLSSPFVAHYTINIPLPDSSPSPRIRRNNSGHHYVNDGDSFAMVW